MFAHGFSFDPTHGCDLAALLRVGPAPEPPGFAAFWRDTFAQAQAVPLALEITPSARALKNFDVFDVRFASFEGVRIHGWLTKPKTGPISRGFVIGHGYGGREGPDPWLPARQAAAIFPCARGLSLSRMPGVPGVAAGHVLAGIGSRETYIHRGCAADVWAAASALLAAVPACAGRLDYLGGSFGGGIGALALPGMRALPARFSASRASASTRCACSCRAPAAANPSGATRAPTPK
jgi:cephalosporin-C deacetylase